ncbi:cysteine hydrolase family protein [Ochrobactrum teleogrylli]|uniref:Cysteine hydrolase n=1 Tax=Ochrobactrum teleogrylli TaxID=2479765 RepID=A0ABY2Y3N0_9HYPH|nr:cysteine hydrolase family protein [[Ochrobactrum] teleogrylli]TNV15911.1 cysteine hydrolase [[Ochrobactrum] teleogrylli]
MARTTLRQLNGFDETPAHLGDSTLIMIDFQNTYTQGVMELDGWQQALDSAAKLLKRAREAGATVIHIVNDGGVGTPYDTHAEIGQIHSHVAPIESEAVVVKTAPDAFVGTNLADLLNSASHDNVIVAGFMTHMCVLFTTARAFLEGKKPTIVANACATRPLQINLTEVSSEQLHHSALATIADLYGVVVPSVDELG